MSKYKSYSLLGHEAKLHLYEWCENFWNHMKISKVWLKSKKDFGENSFLVILMLQWNYLLSWWLFFVFFLWKICIWIFELELELAWFLTFIFSLGQCSIALIQKFKCRFSTRKMQENYQQLKIVPMQGKNK